MIKWIIELFKFGAKVANGEKDGNEIEYRSKNDIKEILDYDEVRDPVILGNKNADKTLLVLDDIEQSCILYGSDFSQIKRKLGIDIYEKFKIVKCIGPDAGYVAMKYLINGHADYAILDITLGMSKKMINGDLIQIDGVDVGKMITDTSGGEYLLSTSHTLNRKNPTMANIINKYEKNNNGADIFEKYMDKNGDRAADMIKLLKLKD